MTKPPKHLSAVSKKLWKSICEGYDIDDAAEIVLTTLLEACDRRTEARQLIAKDGAYTKDRFGQTRPHPALAIERDSGAAVTRCWRLLGFDQEARGEMGRPPGK